MLSGLKSDADVFCGLRWPGRRTAWRRALVWFSSPGLLVLAVQRLGHHYVLQRERQGRTVWLLFLRLLMVLGPRLLVLVCKSDVASKADFEPGVYVSDRGYLILGPQRIGSGTVIHERVTIGVTAGGTDGPNIGRNVWIGPDCIIYGNITIGDGATVLAGSVVSANVSAGSVVEGNPATKVRGNFDNGALRRSLARAVDRAAVLRL